MANLAQVELDMVELLTEKKADEKPHLQNVLQLTASSQAYCSKQRQKLLGPILRFYHAMDEFMERAVSDCEQTVEAIERVRLDYRGSLLWLKKCSDSLDPGDSSHMEDFRTVQQVVKANKLRLDQLKEDVAQKVRVLHEARNQILTDQLRDYKTALGNFYAETAAEFSACSEQFDGLESYEIDVLKILNDPIGLAMEEQRKARSASAAGPTHQQNRDKSPKQHRNRMESEGDAEDLVELEEVELGIEASEPAMDRVRELLRFDDDEPHKSEEEEEQEEVDLMGLDSSVEWRSPPSASGIGLNLLKHSADELDLVEWPIAGSTSSTDCADTARKSPNTKAKAKILTEANEKAPNGREIVMGNGQDQQNKSEPEKPESALLEEIEDILFESCPATPNKLDSPLAIFEESKTNVDQIDQLLMNKMTILTPMGSQSKTVKTDQQIPKLAPPPKQNTNISNAKLQAAKKDQPADLLDELKDLF